MYERLLKRVIDLAVASVAFLLLSPLVVATTVAILLEDGRPVLLRQRRLGRNGTSFEIFKFRSMPVATRAVPSALGGDLPVTRVGAVIRRLNIDELPQLVNVLRGEMSIVGPRPALPTQEELCRLRQITGTIRCRPGLTGLAQVNAYDGMSDSVKADWDALYADTISFARDVAIMAKTFGYLRRRPPVY